MKELERTLKLWDEVNLLELFAERETIQDRLKTITSTGEIADISRMFKLLMQKGHVNTALKLLTSYMNNGILPLNHDTLIPLDQKHPDTKEVHEDTLIDQQSKITHPIVYEVIDEDLYRMLCLQ